jgi:hypothetical protein
MREVGGLSEVPLSQNLSGLLSASPIGSYHAEAMGWILSSRLPGNESRDRQILCPMRGAGALKTGWLAKVSLEPYLAGTGRVSLR